MDRGRNNNRRLVVPSRQSMQMQKKIISAKKAPARLSTSSNLNPVKKTNPVSSDVSKLRKSVNTNKTLDVAVQPGGLRPIEIPGRDPVVIPGTTPVRLTANKDSYILRQKKIQLEKKRKEELLLKRQQELALKQAELQKAQIAREKKRQLEKIRQATTRSMANLKRADSNLENVFDNPSTSNTAVAKTEKIVSPVRAASRRNSSKKVIEPLEGTERRLKGIDLDLYADELGDMLSSNEGSNKEQKKEIKRAPLESRTVKIKPGDDLEKELKKPKRKEKKKEIKRDLPRRKVSSSLLYKLVSKFGLPKIIAIGVALVVVIGILIFFLMNQTPKVGITNVYFTGKTVEEQEVVEPSAVFDVGKPITAVIDYKDSDKNKSIAIEVHREGSKDLQKTITSSAKLVTDSDSTNTGSKKFAIVTKDPATYLPTGQYTLKIFLSNNSVNQENRKLLREIGFDVQTAVNKN